MSAPDLLQGASSGQEAAAVHVANSASITRSGFRARSTRLFRL
ncbi:hypothetical protein [Streptomyces sp. G44]|nr:hypothetical protein [Streptomyces sp. G44]